MIIIEKCQICGCPTFLIISSDDDEDIHNICTNCGTESAGRMDAIKNEY